MNTYNTGKVKIGLLYQPPQRGQDADADALQMKLLGLGGPWSWPRWARFLWGWL
jgi:hypothetical protein